MRHVVSGVLCSSKFSKSELGKIGRNSTSKFEANLSFFAMFSMVLQL